MLSFGLQPWSPAKLRFLHTFFLPKRERKYQRKRFRAAANTPRGHRSCSALSALEIWRRLQRCNCNSQNEALAPLMGRKAHVFGCSRTVSPNTPEGRRALARVIHAAAQKNFCTTAQWQPRGPRYPPKKIFFKMSAATRWSFPFLLFRRNKRKIQPRM